MAFSIDTLGPFTPQPLLTRAASHGATLIVRTLLMVYLGAVVWLHLTTVPTIFEIQRLACEPGTCFWGQVNGETHAWLEERGISPTTYAVIATLIPLMIPIAGHTLAGIAIWQRPTNWLPTLFVLGLAFCTVSASGALWILFMEHPGWERPLYVIHGLMYATGALMVLLFPDGRFVPKWSSLLVGLIAIDVVLLVEPALLVHLPASAQRAWDAWFTYSEFAAIAIIAWRLHVTVDRRARRQTKVWFMAQVPMWCYTAAFLFFIRRSEDEISGAGDLWSILLQFIWAFTILFFISGLLMAIYLYNVYDLSVVIRRSLVYGLLTFALIGLYLITVGTVSIVLGGGENAVPTILATVVIAIAFAPLREWLQRCSRRLLYGDQPDPYGVLTRFGHHLQENAAPERLLRTIVELVQDALQVPEVALAIAGEPALTVRTGGITGDAVNVPIRYQGDALGTLSVVPRTPAEPFSPVDRRLIDEVARQTGIAVHSILLSEDLRRSRERLVTAREEERRRIRRDLHDGLGPALAALSLQVEIARDLVRTAPDRSTELLDDVLALARESILDVRRLVYGLRPPALDDLGLIGAIEAQRDTWEQHGLTVTLDLEPDLPSLSAATEVAIFRIVQEGVNNVIRHAHATSVLVRLAASAGEVWLEIVDDGQGFSNNPQPGVGLLSMHERAAELGGTCTVTGHSGTGVTVTATFPLEPAGPQTDG